MLKCSTLSPSTSSILSANTSNERVPSQVPEGLVIVRDLPSALNLAVNELMNALSTLITSSTNVPATSEPAVAAAIIVSFSIALLNLTTSSLALIAQKQPKKSEFLP